MADHPSRISGVFKRPFDAQVAFFRGKLGDLVPTARWDDMQAAAHDRAFMVAGAAKADLLSDLAAAVDRSIAEGKSLQAFREDFEAIVARNGWTGWTGEDTPAGRAWRTRVIYQTNASTSYAAGREAQLQEGGYPLRVYRHGGSAEPRPQHLAWDGLTLSSDDPFWQTHSPPNGWGCSCYVLGARSERAARRLGGQPDKRPPPPAIDPKTGAPPGIDQGWDYQPGATVAATVRQMAEKTRQWDYTLAKNFMQGVPEGVRDRLARSYRNLPSVATDVRRYVERALGERGGAPVTDVEVQPYRTLGLVTSDRARGIERVMGRSVDGFDYALDASAVRHIAEGHGDPATEFPRGQRPVRPADYASLVGLLDGEVEMEDAGLSRHARRPLVRYRIEHGNDLFEVIWEIRQKRRMLVPVTLFIGRR